jgi:hypothetical protein
MLQKNSEDATLPLFTNCLGRIKVYRNGNLKILEMAIEENVRATC